MTWRWLDQSPKAAVSMEGQGKGLPGAPPRLSHGALGLGGTSHCPAGETCAQLKHRQPLPPPGQTRHFKVTLSSSS